MPYFALSIVSSFFLLLLGISNVEKISRGRSSIATIPFIFCSNGISSFKLDFNSTQTIVTYRYYLTINLEATSRYSMLNSFFVVSNFNNLFSYYTDVTLS